MSEYQCYEFIAIDKALGKKEIAALRAVSTRAEISSRRFWNEYEWGELSAGGRSVAELFAARRAHFEKRKQVVAARAAKAETKRLDALAARVDAWRELEALIEKRAYDEAFELARGLRDLAKRDVAMPAFAARFEALRKSRRHNRGFIDRWKRHNQEAR